MRMYSALHAIPLSFFSKPLYRDVARGWQGSGLLYALLLLAVACVPVVGVVQYRVFGPLAAGLAPLVEQLPPISVTLGEASVEAEQPYVIRDRSTNKAVAIIDTTGKTTSLDGTEASLLLTKTKLFVRRSTGAVSAHDASDLPFRRLDRAVATGWLWWLKGPLAAALYPVLLLLSYMYLIAQAIVCGGVGLFLVRKRRWQFSYQKVMRLACVATTPSVAVATLAILLGVSAPLLAWLAACCALTVGYLCYALRATSELRGSDLGASPDMPSFSIQ